MVRRILKTLDTPPPPPRRRQMLPGTPSGMLVDELLADAGDTAITPTLALDLVICALDAVAVERRPHALRASSRSIRRSS